MLWTVTKCICCSLLLWAGYIGYKTRPWGQGYEIKWGRYWEHVKEHIGNVLRTQLELHGNTLRTTKIQNPHHPPPEWKKPGYLRYGTMGVYSQGHWVLVNMTSSILPYHLKSCCWEPDMGNFVSCTFRLFHGFKYLGATGLSLLT
jgi:hypothetical protein